jgi:hypothetical protein
MANCFDVFILTTLVVLPNGELLQRVEVFRFFCHRVEGIINHVQKDFCNSRVMLPNVPHSLLPFLKKKEVVSHQLNA